MKVEFVCADPDALAMRQAVTELEISDYYEKHKDEQFKDVPPPAEEDAPKHRPLAGPGRSPKVTGSQPPSTGKARSTT